MSATSVQFTVAAHLMTVLAFHHGKRIPSSLLAASINTDPSFVRKSLSKLAKAGLVATHRGKGGSSVLARSPRQITLLDVYRASQAPAAFAIHSYPPDKACVISCSIKAGLSSVLRRAQGSFEKSLARISLADMVAQIRRKSR